MNRLATAIVAAGIVLLPCCAQPRTAAKPSAAKPAAKKTAKRVDAKPAKEPEQKSIGTATMTRDGTIILDLRAEAPDGTVGDARLVYPKTHAQYAEILKHLGGLAPGESKPVPPWPDKR